MNDGPVFACEHVTKRYLSEPVVQNISLALERGGIISLLGPSGVGKTTLFNVLAGVDLPDEGRIFLEGADITGLSGRVSYMMQKDLLMEYRSVLDNVILPLLLRGEKKKSAREKAAAFFPRFGLGGCEKKYPRQLSGGMRQRAALLRTCMTQGLGGAPAGAAVILLDEPFSALDALTRADMQGWFLEIARSLRLSAVCITHDVDEALTLSDSVYILNGRPAALGGRFDTGGKNYAERAVIKNEILRAVRNGRPGFGFSAR
ncbi:MAG: ATP-binding cassette domain-containing protein [Treponema sp.]|jgi:ABC-type nitrate/sulfonate/bicarbonate transport system ATPase subunit|nr:ATP-binding cassette domain-containing protein [Treponema sp.]